MPDLTKTINVYVGQDQSPTLDYTDDTDWQRTELTNMASGGESGTGTWIVRVPDGDVPDARASKQKRLASHNVTKVTVGSNTLFRGRINSRDVSRGPTRGTRPQEWSVITSDYNDDLRGIVVHRWDRPEETDAARAQALVAAYLSGSPRQSTNLNGSNYVITGSNTTTLPAQMYSQTTPMEILQELAEATDKEMFVDIDGALHYHGHDYAGYDSIMRISDDPADLNSLTFAPIEPQGAEEGRDQITSIRSYYDAGGHDHSVVVTSPPAATRNDYWQESFFDDESHNETDAANVAGKILDVRKQDQIGYTVTVGMPGILQTNGVPMSGDDIWKIKPGQRIQFKMRAAKGGIEPGGGYSGDVFTTTRIRSVTWTFPTADAYYARLELERPRKVGPLRRHRGPRQNPTPAPEFTPSGDDTEVKYYSGGSDDPGGDDINWDGINQNQGSAGNAAEGSDAYAYKSAAPDKYQQTNAASADDVFRVSGYIGCTSTGTLSFNFFSNAAGTDGGGSLTVLQTNTISPAQPGHEHAPEWTAWSAGPFTAPAGTHSWALGRTGAVDFDEVHVYAVADPTENDAHAVSYGDCPHESPHFLPSDWLICQLDDISTRIPEVIDDLDDVDTTTALPSNGDVLTWDSTAGQWVPLAGLTDTGQFVTTTDGGKEVVSTVAAAGSTETLDLADGNVHDVTLTADCTLTLTGAVNGVACTMGVLLRQGTGAPWDVTWPGSVNWVGGSAPTLATAEDEWNWVVLLTMDGGTTWFGDGGAAGSSSGSGTGTASWKDFINGRRLILFANRGDLKDDGNSGDSYPENSMEGFRQAMLKGVDGVEVDICFSSNGTPVAMHDTTLNRTTNLTGNVSSASDATIAGGHIDAGFGYNATRHGTSIGIPTFAEIIDACEPYNPLYLLELKAGSATDLATFCINQGIASRTIIVVGSTADGAAVHALDSRIGTMMNEGTAGEGNANIDWLSWDYNNVSSLSAVTATAPQWPHSYIPIAEFSTADEDTVLADVFDKGIRSWETYDATNALALRNSLTISITETDPVAVAHIADTTDAHDASAISIVDAGGYFTGTDVEAALQEGGSSLAAHIAAGSGGAVDHQHINSITYSGDGATTAFELPATPFDAYSVQAFVSGVRTEVTLSGTFLTTMTFGAAPASATDNIKVDLVAAVV